MPFKRKIFCSKRELKKELLDRLVDEDGNKVTKEELSKDKDFLKAIKFNGTSMSTGTISNYCKILADIEPVGVIDEKFLSFCSNKNKLIFLYSLNLLYLYIFHIAT